MEGHAARSEKQSNGDRPKLSGTSGPGEKARRTEDWFVRAATEIILSRYFTAFPNGPGKNQMMAPESKRSACGIRETHQPDRSR
jgi:hypothetical protein